jgi:hypothetical protein
MPGVRSEGPHIFIPKQDAASAPQWRSRTRVLLAGTTSNRVLFDCRLSWSSIFGEAARAQKNEPGGFGHRQVRDYGSDRVTITSSAAKAATAAAVERFGIRLRVCDSLRHRGACGRVCATICAAVGSRPGAQLARPRRARREPDGVEHRAWAPVYQVQGLPRYGFMGSVGHTLCAATRRNGRPYDGVAPFVAERAGRRVMSGPAAGAGFEPSREAETLCALLPMSQNGSDSDSAPTRPRHRTESIC